MKKVVIFLSMLVFSVPVLFSDSEDEGLLIDRGEEVPYEERTHQDLDSTPLLQTYRLTSSWSYIWSLNKHLEHVSFLVGGGSEFRIVRTIEMDGEVYHVIKFRKIEKASDLFYERIRNGRLAEDPTLNRVDQLDEAGMKDHYLIKQSDFTVALLNKGVVNDSDLLSYYTSFALTWGPIVAPFKLYPGQEDLFEWNPTLGYALGLTWGFPAGSFNLTVPLSLGFLYASSEESPPVDPGISLFSGAVVTFGDRQWQGGILAGVDFVLSDALGYPAKFWVSIGLGYQFMSTPSLY